MIPGGVAPPHILWNTAGGGALIFNAWDPNHKGVDVVLSNQDKTATMNVSANREQTVIAVFGKPSGNYQWEVTCDAMSGVGALQIGVAYQTVALNTDPNTIENFWSLVGGTVKTNNVGQTPWTNTGPQPFDNQFYVGDVITVTVDITGSVFKMYKNGMLLQSWHTGTHYDTDIMTHPTYGPWAGTIYPAFRIGLLVTGQVTINTGATPFAYPVGGFSAATMPSTLPSVPTIGTAVAGNASATVAYTQPTNGNGSNKITAWVATSTPGGFTGSGTTSPITVNGLTNGTAYTFTVHAESAAGHSAESAASNSVTPINFSTLNPADKGSGVTLSNGNLTLTSNGTNAMARSTNSHSTGKWSYEVSANGASGNVIGISQAGAALTYVGGAATSWGYYSVDGKKYNNNVGVAYGATYGVNTIRVEYDADTGKLEFFKNNVSQGVAYTLGGGVAMFAAVSGDAGGPDTLTCNFGATAFVNPPTAGYNTYW